ncbi:hypothetical protein Aco04nite_82990 [Winogradskya consettensis]|uniref:Uncharacterized protein n=1 Tax=Winogradskya consettensis TaxID=113560 RepID=A0A919T2Q5_9ACTN|nr:hypothetical protein Aco04nite_82990 [Actinoplanes consettensis]
MSRSTDNPASRTLSMACWMEHHGYAVRTAERKAAHHAQCPKGQVSGIACACPNHKPAAAT